MALYSRFEMLVPACDICDAPWSFAVRMPPMAVCDELDQMISGDSDEMQVALLRMLSSSEDLQAMLGDASEDSLRDALSSPALKSAAIKYMCDADPKRLVGGVPMRTRHDAAVIMQPFCSDPVGLPRDDGQPFTWEQLRAEFESYADDKLYAAAEQVLERYKGKHGQAKLKNS